MTDPILQNPGGIAPLDPTKQSVGGNQPAPSQAVEGPAFQILLERLQAQAKELESATESVDGPEDLAGAVDRARASLDQAQSLSERLLEAYRQAEQGKEAGE